VRIEEGAPSFDWRGVSLPPDSARESDEGVRSLLLHEWGHRTIAPLDPTRGR
jgi:hypothetical protein